MASSQGADRPSSHADPRTPGKWQSMTSCSNPYLRHRGEAQTHKSSVVRFAIARNEEVWPKGSELSLTARATTVQLSLEGEEGSQSKPMIANCEIVYQLTAITVKKKQLNLSLIYIIELACDTSPTTPGPSSLPRLCFLLPDTRSTSTCN